MNMNNIHVFPAELLSTGELVIIVLLSIIVFVGVLFVGKKLGDYFFDKYIKDKINKK